MHDEHPHPLLAQIPLTISPFLSLPTSVPLPYSYVSLPSTLPSSILSSPPQNNASNQTAPSQPAYIHSSTSSSTPDAILSSCSALQQHLQQLEADARKTLRDWETEREKRDLAEKRRVAPGWLDSGVRVLRPEEDEDKGGKMEVENIMDDDPQRREVEKGGEELDRVFGGLKV